MTIINISNNICRIGAGYPTKSTQPGHPFIGKHNEYWWWWWTLWRKRQFLCNSCSCYHLTGILVG